MPNIALAFVVLIPVWIGCVLVFDRLVRREYQEYRAQWELDGRPRGLFWRPPEASQQAAPFLAWLLSTPQWARPDPQARRLLWMFRILCLIWNVVILGVMLPSILLNM